MADEIKETLKIEISLAQIQQQLKTLEGNFKSSFASISQGASSALNAIGISLSVGALVGFGKSVVDLGDKLSDLSDQTGLSIDVLGGIRTIAEQSGSSIDAFAKGINRAQKEMGGLDEAGKKLLQSLGTSQQELVSSSPDEFLEKLARALGTVENRYERNAIGAKLLGKAYAELAPTINDIAENGLPRLAKETAEAYRHLGALKDQTDALKAKLFDLSATLLVTAGQLSGLIPLDETEALGKAAEKVDFLTGAFSRLKGVSKGAIDAKTLDQLREMERGIPDQGAISQFVNPSGKKTLQDLIAAREEQEKLLNLANRPKAPPAQGAFKNLLGSSDDSAAKKLQAALDGYRDSLIKTITQQELEEVKLTLGEQAALKAAQAYDVLALRAKLAADKLPIPPEIQQAATEAEATLKSLGANVEVLGEKSFAKLQGGALAGAAAIDTLKQSLDAGLAAVQAFADAANEGVGLQFLTKEDAAKINEAAKSLNDIQKSITLDLLTESERRQQIAANELDDRIAKINEFATASGASEERRLQLIAKAQEAYFATLGQESDDTSEFMRRAFERGFDAVSDSLRDLMDNGVSSFKDFSEKIRKTIDSLVADFLTLQLKKLVLGDDVGKPGGAIGGLLGGLLGGSSNEKSREDFRNSPAGPDIDLSKATFSVIGDTASVAQTTIMGLQAQAITALQAVGDTALKGLDSAQAVVTDAFSSLLEAGLAAIEAASATSGTSSAGGGLGGLGGIFGGLFGGGGASQGFGSAPAGVEGPSMANGGFFSSIFGSLLSYFGYHEGGQITPGGEFATLKRMVIPKLHGGGEIPIIAKAGEYMINESSAASIGKHNLDMMNLTGALPIARQWTPLHMTDLSSLTRGGYTGEGLAQPATREKPAGDHYEFHFHGVTDADSFRRSRSQMLSDLTRAVEKGKKFT
ncbi:MAG: hypothetical protein ACREQO_22620 [Candidatus Binatia bacterium]